MVETSGPPQPNPPSNFDSGGKPSPAMSHHPTPVQRGTPVAIRPSPFPLPGAGSPHFDQQLSQRPWFDRVLDLIVGEDSPATKYALICERCFLHNGLCQAEEFEQIRR